MVSKAHEKCSATSMKCLAHLRIEDAVEAVKSLLSIGTGTAENDAQADGSIENMPATI